MQPKFLNTFFTRPNSVFLWLFNRLAVSLLARPTTYIVLSLAILLLDLMTGPVLMFPILFVLPVALSALFYGPRLAYVLAGALPLGSFLIVFFTESPASLVSFAINGVVRIVVLAMLAFLVARTVRLNLEIKILHGRLPICMWCKSIRDANGNWQKLETYIAEHSEADFTHGLCPVCRQEHYGNFVGNKNLPIATVTSIA